MIKAKIIADSTDLRGNRLTTFVVTFPRIVLAEINTHRMFSRNSASSRAIPFKKMLKVIKENPFIPLAFQKDHKGMQGKEYLTGIEAQKAKDAWLAARDAAVKYAENASNNNITKQLCNRLLEPFMWHTAIITSSEFDNFFYLRCPEFEVEVEGFGKQIVRSRLQVLDAVHESELAEIDLFNEVDWWRKNQGGAEIHASRLAEVMYDSYRESTPITLAGGQWHIPFGDAMPEGLTEEQQVKIAVARCARVSYTTIGEDKTHDVEADYNLHDRMASYGHWSPFEHVAKCMDEDEYLNFGRLEHDEHIPGWYGNFRGFIQHRKNFLNENQTL